ncbi:hypothetical protein KY290_036829 [Solanum tuberosum]|uniref:Uncharacterized protein n=1 Tax=Solanum tuberosum TaxID=4113 RepID=A0ABQ7TVN8_SOLTU|nr:hypothetical protein KY285_037673 [Solanum tuberosum]KAH0738124.1 hypothetical protein KY290_036829 [Solanum tuberosum]
MNEMRVEMRHFFNQLLQNNPRLNVQDIPGVVGSNLISLVDASSAQTVRGKNIPHSSGSTHDSVLQKKPWAGSEFELQEWSGQDPELHTGNLESGNLEI